MHSPTPLAVSSMIDGYMRRHPEVAPESVPELNLPILKAKRDFYCQYCEKVSRIHGCKQGLRIRSIFGRIRIMQIRIEKNGSRSYLQ